MRWGGGVLEITEDLAWRRRGGSLKKLYNQCTGLFFSHHRINGIVTVDKNLYMQTVESSKHKWMPPRIQSLDFKQGMLQIAQLLQTCVTRRGHQIDSRIYETAVKSLWKPSDFGLAAGAQNLSWISAKWLMWGKRGNALSRADHFQPRKLGYSSGAPRRGRWSC